MLGSPAGPPGGPQRGSFWPLAPAPSATNFTTDSFSKLYGGLYSLFPTGPNIGSAFYSHASTIGRFSGHLQQTGNAFHTTHKVSDSVFSTTTAAGGYTFGAPTPPPGSPYSPIPVAQLELLAKGLTNNIIIQQPPSSLGPPPPPPLLQASQTTASIITTHCEDKFCCNNNNNNIRGNKTMAPCSCQMLGTQSPTKVQKFGDLVFTTSSPSLLGTTNNNNLVAVTATGCSRTNPIEWTTAATAAVTIKKEPGLTPCQVAEITTSVSPIVKLEVTSPGSIKDFFLSPTDSSMSSIGKSMAASSTTTAGVAIPAVAGVPTTLEEQQTAAWPPMGGATTQPMTAPTLWQYPAPVPVESMVPLPVPMPPMGFQIVRDPNSGGLLLLPTTTGLEPVQQTFVWPGYNQAPSVLLPPLPPPPLQLLSTTQNDYLSTSTTLHQTHSTSTRLVAVATENKRKLPVPLPGNALIKLENDVLEESKMAVSTLAGSTNFVGGEPLIIYQPNNMILSSQNTEEIRSQATSPVTCLTPPPEAIASPEQQLELPPPMVQDAGNQTEPGITEPEEELESKMEDEEPSTTTEEPSNVKPDLSGLELLSNSIVEFESHRTVKEEEPKPSSEDNLGGLNLLCALAEQRILEETSTITTKERRRKDKRKAKKKRRHHEKKSSKSDCSCSNYHKYKTPESEKTTRRFLASKNHPIFCKNGPWPCMNELELDMRMKLAEIQRQYREKQRELSKLKPKKHRKKSSEHSPTPPPFLDKMDDLQIKPKSNSDLLKPPKLSAISPLTTSPCTTPDNSPTASQKRKVGRPKKFLTTTETIVAKKPKTIVSFLLAAKEKLQHNFNYLDSPPRYLEDKVGEADHRTSKIRPKLKAEATLKHYSDEELEPEEPEYEEFEEMEEEDEVLQVEIENNNNQEEPAVTLTAASPPRIQMCEPVKPEDTRCVLTTELLEVDKLRVLTAMGGLFYAGQLNAVEPPDVYSITLDGERGNRPHFMSREEILRDAIVEVSPQRTADLPVGTRLCAYWSQQYRCLYPGSVAEPGTPNPELDEKFVSVEFDDGDSGRIALEDIRFLPPDYPIIEYDPNPLLSLSKRKRRNSTSISTEERKVLIVEPIESHHDTEKENSLTEKYKEKKRLKKKKRDKLKQKMSAQPTEELSKKKKKKHKCNDENCKHKKHHKKHRKHRKHHRGQLESIIRENVLTVEPEEPPAPKFEPPILDEENSIPNPEDEVTMDDIIEATQSKKSKKFRDRQESCESRSKMSAFLPARQLWGWAGKGYKRQRAKGRSKKSFYKSIQRGKETITVGDSAVFLSTGRPDRPYIGRIEAMWELCSTMVVRVKWFYHPEETVGCPMNLQYPGALFESPHVDENDVQTISHKCEVLPLKDYTERLGDDPQRYETIYDNNDIYYLAGYYDPTATTLKMEPGIPFTKTDH